MDGGLLTAQQPSLPSVDSLYTVQYLTVQHKTIFSSSLGIFRLGVRFGRFASTLEGPLIHVARGVGLLVPAPPLGD